MAIIEGTRIGRKRPQAKAVNIGTAQAVKAPTPTPTPVFPPSFVTSIAPRPQVSDAMKRRFTARHKKFARIVWPFNAGDPLDLSRFNPDPRRSGLPLITFGNTTIPIRISPGVRGSLFHGDPDSPLQA